MEEVEARGDGIEVRRQAKGTHDCCERTPLSKDKVA